MIFDEPTTVLIPQEIQDLFTTIRSLTAEGKGIVLITHKLDELLEITDRITVLRAGRSSGTLRTADVDGQTLARLMVGRDVQLRTTAAFVGLDTDPAATATARILDRSGPPALSLQGIGVVDHGVHRLTGITLDVARGEILGVAGVEGNGQRKLVEVLCGTRPASEGTMQVHRNDVTSAGPVGLRAVGVRIVTEDRHATGCVLDMTVGENLLCDRIGDAPYSRAGIIARRSVDDAARELIRDYRVKTPGPGTPMRALSGGNQQRAILARELSRPVDVLVAAQPTRGLDVGAIEEVTERINAARDGGAAALLVSSDLTEILALSDRVSVIYRGEIVSVLDRADAHHDRLGELMAGLTASTEVTA